MPVTGKDFYGGLLKVEGLDSVYNALKSLPEDVAKGIVQKALMSGGEDIRAAITMRAPVGRTRNLRTSITVRPHSKKANWFTVLQGKGAGFQYDVGPEYSRAKKGYAGHLVEFGTKPHFIIAGVRYKTLYSGKIRGKLTKTGALYDKYTKRYFGKIQLISAVAHPFVRPAFLSSKTRALRTIADSLRREISMAFQKRVG